MSVSAGVIEHAPILRPVNSRVFFSFFLCLHHQNNRSENISISYLLFFNLAAYKHICTHIGTVGYARTNVVGCRNSFVVASLRSSIY